MRMQSSSQSGRVAYCLPIGITSSKTKCVRLRNGRSLQHPKSSMPLEGLFLCCAQGRSQDFSKGGGGLKLWKQKPCKGKIACD